MSNSRQPAPQKSKGYIFRPWRRLKNGRILWAKDYGHQAWKIPIGKKAK